MEMGAAASCATARDCTVMLRLAERAATWLGLGLGLGLGLQLGLGLAQPPRAPRRRRCGWQAAARGPCLAPG